MTATVYECIYCDFTTEDEQKYNRHMFHHQEADSWEDEEPEDPALPEIPFMWDGRIVQ